MFIYVMINYFSSNWTNMWNNMFNSSINYSCFKKLQGFYPKKFELVAIAIDLSNGEMNYDKIEKFCKTKINAYICNFENKKII